MKKTKASKESNKRAFKGHVEDIICGLTAERVANLLAIALVTFLCLLANKHFISSFFTKESPTYESGGKHIEKSLPIESQVRSEDLSSQKESRLSSQTSVETSKSNFVGFSNFHFSSSKAPRFEANETSIQKITSAASSLSLSKGSPKKSDEVFTTSAQCSEEESIKYRTIIGSDAHAEQNLKWCNNMRSAHRVQVGRSWGTLSREQQKKWDENKCNELMTIGKLQSCSEQWGWSWFEKWKSNKKSVFTGGSNVTCIVDYKTTTYCEMQDVVLDFSKMSVHGGSRAFGIGFLNMYGKGQDFSQLPVYPGISIKKVMQVPSVENEQCDQYESRPTFILSNDDIFNLGHYINDVIGVWAMTVLANRAFKDSLLINIDGLRVGGPAGGPAHRMMVPSSPDSHGPYNEYYFGSWYQEVKKAIDYGQKRVCFKELYVFPLPGVPWFWNDWGRINDCSMQSSSPLYQSFNYFLRAQLVEKLGGGDSALLLPPQDDTIHIVIEVRRLAKRNKHGIGRYIRNLAALVSALSKIPKVKVTAQDFASLSFIDQMKLAHTASILVSMHGAGTTHIFHSAIGQKNCCGLIELFPDKSVDLYAAEGYGNLARMLGFYHKRLVAADGQTNDLGTAVDVEAIKSIAEDMIAKMKQKPTCGHDIKDTRYPIYNFTSL